MNYRVGSVAGRAYVYQRRVFSHVAAAFGRVDLATTSGNVYFLATSPFGGAMRCGRSEAIDVDHMMSSGT